MSPFEDLLKELGQVLKISLHVDRSQACSIQLGPKLIVQLQLDPTLEHLWIFAKLFEIPPGKFREEVLKEALKTNAQPDPRAGVLSYLALHHSLALFQKYPVQILTKERLAGVIGAFVEMAEKWQEAFEKGLSSPQGKEEPPNPFNLS